MISEAFYALTIYPSHERFFSNIAYLLGLSVVITDEDNSTLSRALTCYLSSIHNVTENEDD